MELSMRLFLMVFILVWSQLGLARNGSVGIGSAYVRQGKFNDQPQLDVRRVSPDWVHRLGSGHQVAIIELPLKNLFEVQNTNATDETSPYWIHCQESQKHCLLIRARAPLNFFQIGEELLHLLKQK